MAEKSMTRGIFHKKCGALSGFYRRYFFWSQ